MPEVEFIAAYWTLAGDAIPLTENELSPFSLQDRVRIAAEAGYSGIGLIHADLVHQRKNLGYPTIRSIFRDHGLKYLELEFLGDWFADGERKRQSDAIKHDLFEAAAELKARHLKVGGDFLGKPWPTSRLIESFGQVCEEARDYGLLLALEPQPWTNISTINLGLEIVSAVNASNGGLLVDIWHVARGGNDYRDILKIPAHLIKAVELDDARLETRGTLWEDTIHHRELCGEGELDPPTFLKYLQEVGYTGPYGIEIISETHRTRTLPNAAKKSIETALLQFQRAGNWQH
jgi:sugar phosphate isomerase/epimerase